MEITTPLVALCVSVFPSSVVTLTDLFGARTPVPLIQVILFFLKRNSTPLEFCVLTSRERFIATPKSSLTSPTFTPNSAACLTRVARLAASSSALAGMQPQSTQVPPSPSRSTTATVEAELGAADGAHVSGGAAAEEDHVKGCHGLSFDSQ